MKKYWSPVLLYTLVLASCGDKPKNPNPTPTIKEAPDSRNNPEIFGVSKKKLSEIQSAASLIKKGWSDSYWPTYQGGISHRWQTDEFGADYAKYLYPIQSMESVAALAQDKLDKLSPAEKYDLWMNDSNFSLTKVEQKRTKDAVRNGAVETWFGLCHGWAPASIMESEAGKIATVENEAGVEINFYSSDIKALMTKIYADAKVETSFIGGRCNDSTVELDVNGRPVKSECRDTNPATFHLVLDEYIAKKKESFVADVTDDAEVWNQPIAGYSFTYSNKRKLSDDSNYKHAAQGTVMLVDVETKLTYVVETKASRNPVNSMTQSKVMKYTLELSADETIIGGEWASKNKPDFMWKFKVKPENFAQGKLTYESVKKLLDKSLDGNTGGGNTGGGNTGGGNTGGGNTGGGNTGGGNTGGGNTGGGNTGGGNTGGGNTGGGNTGGGNTGGGNTGGGNTGGGNTGGGNTGGGNTGGGNSSGSNTGGGTVIDIGNNQQQLQYYKDQNVIVIQGAVQSQKQNTKVHAVGIVFKNVGGRDVEVSKSEIVNQDGTINLQAQIPANVTQATIVLLDSNGVPVQSMVLEI